MGASDAPVFRKKAHMNSESASGDETARQIDVDKAQTHERKRGSDRRVDLGGLFGGYNGPERRSGRDRRAGG